MKTYWVADHGEHIFYVGGRLTFFYVWEPYVGTFLAVNPRGDHKLSCDSLAEAKLVCEGWFRLFWLTGQAELHPFGSD